MNPSGRSNSVIAAAVIGILASLLAILSTIAAIVGLSVMPPGNVAAIPPFAKSMVVAMMVLFAGLAIFGIFTSVGVLRLKNWARISMLIWGGVMAIFCGLALVFVAFGPLQEPPGPSLISLSYVRLLFSVVYGIPFLIA